MKVDIEFSEIDPNELPTVMINGKKFVCIRARVFQADSSPESRKRRSDDSGELDEGYDTSESGTPSRPKKSLAEKIMGECGYPVKNYSTNIQLYTSDMQQGSSMSESENRPPQNKTSQIRVSSLSTLKDDNQPDALLPMVRRTRSSDRRSLPPQPLVKELAFLCEHQKYLNMVKKHAEKDQEEKRKTAGAPVIKPTYSSEPRRLVKIKENTYRLNIPKAVSAPSLLNVSSAREIIPATPGTLSIKKKVAYFKNIIGQRGRSISSTSFSNPNWADSVANEYKELCLQAAKKLSVRQNNVKVFCADKNRLLEERMVKRTVENLKRKPVIEVPQEEPDEYPELTKEMENWIESLLVPHPANEVLCQFHGLSITRTALNCLYGLNWLNDDVINMYMELLMERSKQDAYPSVYAFNSFFFPKVMLCGQIAVRRWTRKVDIFQHDFIVIPCHLGIHWTVMIVDFRKKKISYYDSIGNPNTDALNAILKYLIDEHMDKKQTPFDVQGWQTVNEEGPQQKNGSDCGVFSCMTAEHITRGAKLSFTQQRMNYFRKKMVYEIVKSKLLM